MNKQKKSLGGILLQILTLIFLLEPIWMLLPFAGFLYGSAVNLDFLGQSRFTAWLLYFVFPVQTLFIPAVIMISAGFLIFLIGAFQIYHAKLFKKGLVKTFLYKKLRNPQYTGLTILSVGFLMIWGRFITYIIFGLMMVLYYYLAKKEEKICSEAFGEEYENYKKTSFFLFPGEIIFSYIGRLFGKIISHNTFRAASAFILIQVFIIAGCLGVLKLRGLNIKNMPHQTSEIAVNGKKIDFILVKGELKNESLGQNFADEFIDRLTASQKFKETFSKIDMSEVNTVFGYFIPRTVRKKSSYYNEGKYDMYFLLLKSDYKLKHDNFNIFKRDFKVIGSVQINKVNVRNSSDELIGADILVRIAKNENESHDIKSYFKIFMFSHNTKIADVAGLIE